MRSKLRVIWGGQSISAFLICFHWARGSVLLEQDLSLLILFKTESFNLLSPRFIFIYFFWVCLATVTAVLVVKRALLLNRTAIHPPINFFLLWKILVLFKNRVRLHELYDDNGWKERCEISSPTSCSTWGWLLVGTRLLRSLSTQVLKTSKDGDLTAFQYNLFQ